MCLILNSSIPGFFVTAFDYGQFQKVIKFQSVMFEYFSFSVIPIKILGSMFQDRTVNSAQKSDRKTSPYSNMSLANIGVNQITGKYNGQRIWNFTQASYPVTFASLFASLKQNCSDPPISPVAFLGLFMICFFLLPRSNVNDAYASILNRVLGGTRLDRSSRVFYFPVNSGTQYLIPAGFYNKQLGFSGIKYCVPMFFAYKDFLYFPDNSDYILINTYTREYVSGVTSIKIPIRKGFSDPARFGSQSEAAGERRFNGKTLGLPLWSVPSKQIQSETEQRSKPELVSGATKRVS
ncbi:MAG: hypothetical protein NT145_08840 [Elusimicrobia bacterium]|nr:hypothetical protein [Elusimicrobiota bacterium]